MILWFIQSRCLYQKFCKSRKPQLHQGWLCK